MPNASSEIRECQQAIEGVHAAIFTERNSNREANSKSNCAATITASDAEQLERARKSKDGEKFIRLCDLGDWKGEGYASQSEADQALCGMLGFWLGQDAARIDAAFRRSSLSRGKWNRDDYSQRTIEKALPGTSITLVPTPIAKPPSIPLTELKVAI